MEIPIPQHLRTSRHGAFLVGGSVRDLIKGIPPLDYDVVVPADPAGYADEIAAKIQGHTIVLGKDRFAVYRVASPHGYLDVTAYKGRDIHQDLLARDFTFNALACELATGRIIDPTGGLDDLHQGVVRMVSPGIFQEDPARLIRAFRLAATMEFRIHPVTADAIDAQAHLLKASAAERIWTELIRILASNNAHAALTQMIATRILSVIFPELPPLSACRQNRHHDWDALQHSLEAVRALERILNDPVHYLPPSALPFAEIMDHQTRGLLKLSLMLHDMGKPTSRSIGRNGRLCFHGHAARGAEMMQVIGRRLRMANKQRDWVSALIRKHQDPLALFLAGQKDQKSTARATGRFFRRCGDQTPYLLLHALADNMGKRDGAEFQDPEVVQFLISLLATYFDKQSKKLTAPLLSGRDLIDKFKVKPSPLIGILLRRMVELQMRGDISDRHEAFDWAARHLKRVKPI